MYVEMTNSKSDIDAGKWNKQPVYDHTVGEIVNRLIVS